MSILDEVAKFLEGSEINTLANLRNDVRNLTDENKQLEKRLGNVEDLILEIFEGGDSPIGEIEQRLDKLEAINK